MRSARERRVTRVLTGVRAVNAYFTPVKPVFHAFSEECKTSAREHDPITTPTERRAKENSQKQPSGSSQEARLRGHTLTDHTAEP